MSNVPKAEADRAAASAQLGRPLRGPVAVGHRCACGLPDVIVTPPRLPEGTPFPTTFYLTCPRATAALSTLESEGVMVQMASDLAEDQVLRAAYQVAHEDYLRRRAEVAAEFGVDPVPEIEGVSAGGMPTRVKCLHSLAGHALAAGPGVNPLGDRALAMIAERGLWACATVCVSEEAE
ncbi:MAG: DUF501 domain-containing protein [Candidatus Nanopelagicales bacterium]